MVQGDYEPVPLPARNDELRDLVESANRLADQLDESQRAIQRGERLALLGQLSGGLAHQLRNAVTGARIAVELHERHCHSPDVESIRVALRQLALTESHLQRFLTIGRPTGLRYSQCDLRQVIADIAALVLPMCRHRNVAYDERYGAQAEGNLWADAGQLRQLLLNLVLNAVEAAGPGGWVRVELDARGADTILRVLDSGPGPSDDLLERLFEPFVTGKADGIGLGLAEGKRIAEAHGGRLTYLSQRPTCFEACLPRAKPDAMRCRPASERTAVEPAASDFARGVEALP
jgi:signal transduction histidine kinase